MGKKTFYLKTFGCQLNQADSERIKAKLESQGLIQTQDSKTADLVVINSCIVRHSAENRVYGLIRNLKAKYQKPKIILTGCLAGWALRAKNKKNLNNLKKKIGPSVEIKLIEEFVPFKISQKRTCPDTALVPISNGCNHYCSYCIVPYARGKEVYLKSEKIINDVKKAVKIGISKIMLLGQNVNAWQGQGKIKTFAQLLELVAQIQGAREISFLSSNPWDFSSELINVIAKNDNIVKKIHLPLQSGSNRILKLMNREYTKKDYLRLVAKIKSAIPEAKFTTDIIIGFPTETDQDFQDTLEVCQKVKFKKAYLNKYSPRPGTLASAKYPDDIPIKIKKARWQILEKLINQAQA